MGEVMVGYDKAMPAWSYDGAFIGFHAKVEQGRFGLFMANADATEMRLLIYPPESGDSLHFAWSPDGTQIAFAEFRTDGRFLYHLTLTNPPENPISNRARMQLLTANGYFPAWSPDGAQLVYVRDMNMGSRLWIYDIVAQTHYPLNTDVRVYDDTHPDWSADGAYIIFASNRAGSSDLYIMRSDGSGVRRLTYHTGESLAPDWEVISADSATAPKR